MRAWVIIFLAVALSGCPGEGGGYMAPEASGPDDGSKTPPDPAAAHPFPAEMEGLDPPMTHTL